MRDRTEVSPESNSAAAIADRDAHFDGVLARRARDVLRALVGRPAELQPLEDLVVVLHDNRRAAVMDRTSAWCELMARGWLDPAPFEEPAPDGHVRVAVLGAEGWAIVGTRAIDEIGSQVLDVDSGDVANG